MAAITFKVSAEEARRIRQAARAARSNVSAYIRAAVLPPSGPRPKVAIRRHPVSGLPFNAAGANLRPVSQAEIKVILSDFP